MSRGAKVALAAVVLAGAVFLVVSVRPRYQENRRRLGMSFSQNVSYSLAEALRLKHSFSQFSQDAWVSEVVFPGVANGFFLDVGSADGTIGSNSKLLEQHGWRGICIDPFPTNMGDRSCQIFKDVVWNEAGQKVQFRQAKDLGGVDQTLGAWKDTAQKAQLVEFTTVTLADILSRAKAPSFINYLSLDIEGAEFAALQGFPWDRYKVGAMTIEHNFEEPKRSRIKELLESKGYRRAYESILDDFYVPAAPSR